MKVVRNDDNQTLTRAEMEACRQFGESARDGGIVIHPAVSAGRPAPNCVAFLKQVGRFAITIVEGHHGVEDGRWFRREDDGSETSVDNPLEAAWQAARSVRIALEPELKFQPYVIAAAWFADMEESEDILDEADGRSARVLFGPVDLASVLAGLPRDDERQTRLSLQYIEQEMMALSRSSVVASEPTNLAATVEGKAGMVSVGPVETVNIYITVVNGDGDREEGPPLIALQGQ